MTGYRGCGTFEGSHCQVRVRQGRMHKFVTWLFVLSVGVCFFVTESPSWAQETGLYQMRNRAAQYYLGTEDELLVPVNIWGFVQRPGQYMVPNNTDLISLLSFAGGPVDGAKISNVKIVRSDPNFGERVWKVNVKKYLKTGEDRLIPVLKPGDTVVVKGTTYHWLRNFFSFLASFSVFVQMFYWIIVAQQQLKD